MLIDADALKHWIENFYGYGSWQARFWFVGFEENGGDAPEEVAGKLNYFRQLETKDRSILCDIRELFRHVNFRLDGPSAKKFSNLNDYRFGDNATLHGAWKNLIAFEHGYNDQEVPDLLHYQKNSFALPSAAGAEALIPLYPLPAHHHAWYYAWLEMPQFPFLKNRTAYQEYVYPERIAKILQNITIYHPKVVVMYGMDNINLLKKSVQDAFPNAKFKMAKAVKRQIPQHHYADLDGTVLVLTTQIPALKHKRIETGFDWYELGKLVKAYADA